MNQAFFHVKRRNVVLFCLLARPDVVDVTADEPPATRAQAGWVCGRFSGFIAGFTLEPS